MNTEAECYWMTDQVLRLMIAVPDAEWTDGLSQAGEMRQDFHDWTCRWDAQQEGEGAHGAPRAPKPDPVTFRRQMEKHGFVFDVAAKTVTMQAKGK